MASLHSLLTPPALTVPAGEPPEGVEVLWRAEARRYSYVIDADAELYGTSAPRLELWWHRVKRWTPRGARLNNGKYVNLDKNISRREWASRTKEEAVESFIARRRRQISLLQGQLNYAEQELALATRCDL